MINMDYLVKTLELSQHDANAGWFDDSFLLAIHAQMNTKAWISEAQSNAVKSINKVLTKSIEKWEEKHAS